jgi:hypothetical protein
MKTDFKELPINYSRLYGNKVYNIYLMKTKVIVLAVAGGAGIAQWYSAGLRAG